MAQLKFKDLPDEDKAYINDAPYLAMNRTIDYPGYEEKRDELIAKIREGKKPPNKAELGRWTTAVDCTVAWLLEATLRSGGYLRTRIKNLPPTRGRYASLGMGESIMNDLISGLQNLGYIDSVPGFRSPCGNYSKSRAIRGTDSFLRFMGLPLDRRGDVISSKSGPLVRLKRKGKGKGKSKSKRLLSYSDTAQTDRIKSRLSLINKALDGVDIGCVGPASSLYCERVTLLHRTFSKDFTHLGRFYGGFWQTMPSKHRPYITLNGEPTVEIDFVHCAPSLAYAEVGLALEGDPYDMKTLSRKAAKIAFMRMMNGDYSRPKPPRKTDVEIEGTLNGARSLDIATELNLRHASLLAKFNTVDGSLRLQYTDSQIAEYILLDMMVRQGIPTLPIHDSFIVPVSKEQELLSSMTKGFHLFAGEGGRCAGLRITRHDGTVETLDPYSVEAYRQS